MGTGQNRPTVNLPLAAANLLNRLRQSIHRPRQGKTCNSGAPTKPACVSRRGIRKFARKFCSGPARSAGASGDSNAKSDPDFIVATNFKKPVFNEGKMQRNNTFQPLVLSETRFASLAAGRRSAAAVWGDHQMKNLAIVGCVGLNLDGAIPGFAIFDR